MSGMQIGTYIIRLTIDDLSKMALVSRYPRAYCNSNYFKNNLYKVSTYNTRTQLGLQKLPLENNKSGDCAIPKKHNFSSVARQP